MIKRLLFLFFLIICLKNSSAQETGIGKWLKKPAPFEYVGYNKDSINLSTREYKLYRLIMEYRKTVNKPVIPLSRALCFVARTHAGDLDNTYIYSKNCNINSWSKKGKWTPCCYTKDHSKADCMWNKPRELTTYPGDGFEVVYWKPSDLTPEGALEKWKNNPLNNQVILNTGEWAEETWEAIGIGIFGGFATVWFGKVPDPDGEPGIPVPNP